MEEVDPGVSAGWLGVDVSSESRIPGFRGRTDGRNALDGFLGNEGRAAGRRSRRKQIQRKGRRAGRKPLEGLIRS